jgi:hypothetical protein
MSGTGKFQTSGILGLENSMPHVIYDLSLPLPERKEKAIVFQSVNALMRHFRCGRERIIDCRLPGKRFKDRNGKEWAIRIAPPEMIDRLKK